MCVFGSRFLVRMPSKRLVILWWFPKEFRIIVSLNIRCWSFISSTLEFDFLFLQMSRETRWVVYLSLLLTFRPHSMDVYPWPSRAVCGRVSVASVELKDRPCVVAYRVSVFGRLFFVRVIFMLTLWRPLHNFNTRGPTLVILSCQLIFFVLFCTLSHQSGGQNFNDFLFVFDVNLRWKSDVLLLPSFCVVFFSWPERTLNLKLSRHDNWTGSHSVDPEGNG